MQLSCGGKYRTWGCECLRCVTRCHPFDIMARLTREEKDAIGAARPETRSNREKRCYCGQPGRFYAGGFRCDAHTRQAPRMLSPRVRSAIGSYVREHGTRPWPWRDGTPSELTYQDEPDMHQE